MRTKIFILSLLIMPIITQAQVFDKLNEVRSYHSGLRASIGVFNNNFQNSEVVKNGALGKNGTGLVVGGAFNFHPFSINANYMVTTYDSSDLVLTLPAIDTVYYRGGNVFLDFNLLPKSKYFYPYMGIGYQFSKINSKSNIIDTSHSSVLWRIGTHFVFSGKWSMKIEYSSSLPDKLRTEGKSFKDWRLHTFERKNSLHVLSISVLYNLLNQ